MSDYVLNTFALKEIYKERSEATGHLASVLRALATLDDGASIQPAFRSDIDLWLPQLRFESGPDASLGELASSLYETDDHDVAEYFDALSRTTPADSGLNNAALEALLNLEPTEPLPGLEETFVSVEAAQLSALLCAVMNYTLVSFPRDPKWNFSEMGFVGGQVSFRFDHLATVLHAEAVRQRRIEAARLNLRVNTFWSIKETVFPDLLFGLDVETQLERFSATLRTLLFTRLGELNADCGRWKSLETNAFPGELSPESSLTMDNYGSKRRFRGYDGEMRTFEEHVWVDRSHRIHVFRHPGKKLEVGYVGRHLKGWSN
jgi:hypothetical protein